MSAPEFAAFEEQVRLLKFITDPRNERMMRTDANCYDAAFIGLNYGEPYYWSSPICALIEQAAEQLTFPWFLEPWHVPAPQGFFYFDRPVSVSTTPLRPGEQEEGRPVLLLRGFAWSGYTETSRDETDTGVDRVGIEFPRRGGAVIENTTGIAIQFFSEASYRRGHMIPAGYTLWRFGRSHLDLARDEGVRLDMPAQITDPFTYGGRDNAAVACAFQFIAQKILALATGARLDRATRRRMEREKVTLTDPMIRVVRLRRKEREDYIPPEDHAEVEWACQWYVRGFWRMDHCMRPKQHAEGTCFHQPVWVSPHWKGPEDAPVKTPHITLYGVRQ